MYPGPIKNSTAVLPSSSQWLMRPVVRRGVIPGSLGRGAVVLGGGGGQRSLPSTRLPWAWNRDGQAPPLTGPPEELADQFRSYAREGVDHLQVWVNPTPAGLNSSGGLSSCWTARDGRNRFF